MKQLTAKFRLSIFQHPNGCWTYGGKLARTTALRKLYVNLVGPLKKTELPVSTCADPACVNPTHQRLEPLAEVRSELSRAAWERRKYGRPRR